MSENRLGNEKSLYLKQHADNPVHWFPWGEDALKKATDENKPIFLSIGYSSCHWCHVMEEESFEDKKTADFLNENFVCIKVDREESPDLDQYYQDACQYYSGRGGWPLSAFLLPDTSPFFVSTYFPKEAQRNIPSFMTVLSELKRVYEEDLETAQTNAKKAVETIAKGPFDNKQVEFDGHFPAPSAILNALKEIQDNDHGGYGQAPKFPHFAFYEWAIESMLEGVVTKEQAEHVFKTLDGLFFGGVMDQVKGGIHRYSVDEKWLVPHFEKMLYDQSGLLRLLSKASLLSPNPLFLDHINSALDYLKTEMLSDEGFFFSAQDADSEGEEGLYFTFTSSEFEELIDESEDQSLKDSKADLQKWFQMTEEGNFGQALNVVSLNPAFKTEYFEQENWEKIRKVKSLLLNERKQRIPPATDHKGVASWNFMLISSLCDIIQYCPAAPLKEKAFVLLDKSIASIQSTFLQQLPKEESAITLRIRHTTTKEETIPHFEDYVFFLEMQLRLYETFGESVFKENLKQGLHFALDEFFDGNDALTRAKSFTSSEKYPNASVKPFDQSYRSPLSTLLQVGRRSAVLFSDLKLKDRLEEIATHSKNKVLQHPLGCGEGLRALSYPEQIYKVVKVPKEWLKDSDFIQLRNHLTSRFCFDYSQDSGFQICGINACEQSGKTAKELMELFKPKAPESDNGAS